MKLQFLKKYCRFDIRCTVAVMLSLIVSIYYLIISQTSNVSYKRYHQSNAMSINKETKLENTEQQSENYYKISIESFEKLRKETFGAIKIEKIVEVVELIQYDVTRPVPDEAKNIECIVMKNADPPYNVCLAAKDGTSQDLKGTFSWENDIQAFIKHFYKEHPTAMFLDLGMHIGLHSLYAAVLNKNVHVLAVEPFPESIVTLHKATHLNSVQSRFKVSRTSDLVATLQIVVGAVSNKRGPLKVVGGFSGLTILHAKEENTSFYVNAVTINDLTSLLKVKKVLLKMDIEASECHVFANADKIFAEVDIPAIIMEIGRTKDEGACCFESMLKFLSDRNYKGFYFNDNKTPLDFKNWRQWNFGVNIYFKKFY